MPLFLISSRFHSHPAVMLAPDAAIGLWVRAGSWTAANGGDGFIPRDVVERFEALPQALELVRVGLWENARGGWRMRRELPAVPGCKPLPLWSLGGQDTEDNLRVLCRPCNSRKGARI